MPFQTICALLGLDLTDREAFARLGVQRFDVTGGIAGQFGAVSAQRQFLFDAVARQRKEPGPGLIGQIIRDEGDRSPTPTWPGWPTASSPAGTRRRPG